MIHITLLHSCIATPKFLKGVNNLTKYSPLSESLSFINSCPFLTIVKLVWKLRTIAVTESDLLQKVIRYRERVCFLCWMHAGIGRGPPHWSLTVLSHVGGAASAVGAMAGGSWEPGRWQGPAWRVPQPHPRPGGFAAQVPWVGHRHTSVPRAQSFFTISPSSYSSKMWVLPRFHNYTFSCI